MTLTDAKLGRYRVAPFQADRWKVQERKLFIWWDVLKMIGQDTYEQVWFDLESEAENWITQRLKAEARTNQLLKQEREHKRRYAPRIFP